MKLKNQMVPYFFTITTLATIAACVHSGDVFQREPAKQNVQSSILFEDKYKVPSMLNFYKVDGDHVTSANYDLTSAGSLQSLIDQAEALNDFGKEQKASGEKITGQVGDKIPLVFSSKGIRFGLKEISHQAKILLKVAPGSEAQRVAVSTLHEVAHAIKNDFRNPWVTDYQLFEAPFVAAKMAYPQSPVMGSDTDSKIDPLSSSFWENRPIQSLELFNGFGRSHRDLIDQEVCAYDKAKAGWGTNTGFHIRCQSGVYKLKFGPETLSGPFNTRIHWALGYNVGIIEIAHAPKVAYDRRIFTEYNQRKNQDMKLKLGPKTILQVHTGKYADPFGNIAYVVMKDGRKLSTDEFKARLFRNFKVQAPETVADNFNPDTEAQVQYIVFTRGSVARKSDSLEIGPWDWESFDHPLRREVRGLQMLSAWVSNFDTRWENNRLVAERSEDGYVLKHYLSDVGSGLGKTSSILHKSSSSVNEMEWAVTSIRTEGGEVANSKIVIDGMVTTQENSSFEKMTYEDGRWMIRKLALLSDQQIYQALAASGMSAAEARLVFEKLISRRNNMIENFDLTQELSYAVKKVDRKLNYDPSREPLMVRLADGTDFTFPVDGSRIVKGVLVH